MKLANYPSRPLTESIDSVVMVSTLIDLAFQSYVYRKKIVTWLKNEIKNKVGAWVTVDIEKSSQDSGANDDVGGFGSVLIIHAELISKWTGGYYKSTSHRVVLEPGSSSTVGGGVWYFIQGQTKILE